MSVDKIIVQMKNNQQNIRYDDLCRVCEYFFGRPRNNGTSHTIYKTPWVGDPRVNV
jgi:hypothetical protein